MKKCVLYGSILLLALAGCVSTSKKSELKEAYYVIPHHEQMTYTTRFKQDFSILFFYGAYNFLLTDNRVFLHRKSKGNTSNENSDNLTPPFLGLVTKDIIEIPLNELPKFLNQNVLDTISGNKKINISIASITDSITNPAFISLNDFFQTKKHYNYIIRNWTEEETEALKAKLANKAFNPDTLYAKSGTKKTAQNLSNKKALQN